jgi:hypothetical protein
MEATQGHMLLDGGRGSAGEGSGGEGSGGEGSGGEGSGGEGSGGNGNGLTPEQREKVKELMVELARML